VENKDAVEASRNVRDLEQTSRIAARAAAREKATLQRAQKAKAANEAVQGPRAETKKKLAATFGNDSDANDDDSEQKSAPAAGDNNSGPEQKSAPAKRSREPAASKESQAKKPRTPPAAKESSQDFMEFSDEEEGEDLSVLTAEEQLDILEDQVDELTAEKKAAKLKQLRLKKQLREANARLAEYEVLKDRIRAINEEEEKVNALSTTMATMMKSALPTSETQSSAFQKPLSVDDIRDFDA
jgi:chromosome segregation ATPase